MAVSSTSFGRGHEKRGGRVKGQANSDTEKMRKLAKRHAPEALRVLVANMRDKTNNTSDRNAAAKELLDRAYGKASAIVGGDASNPVRVVIQGDDTKL